MTNEGDEPDIRRRHDSNDNRRERVTWASEKAGLYLSVGNDGDDNMIHWRGDLHAVDGT